ncbi:MAG: hypothetical protein JWN31_933 [Frankiales bacterium]|nr:hypothetical protein [Frankiales bacterium]
MGVPELYEVILVDSGARWHVGWLADDEAETDVLLRDGGQVPLFGSRPALEHFAQEADLELNDDLPDQIDLDLGGWLTVGEPEPPLPEVLELWQLLYDDPVAKKALGGELLGEAYDDLTEEADGWFQEHGTRARKALNEAVGLLRKDFRRL